MKKNKGFTLIELLAVIVILAVIALIATPIIMNVINDSKEGAAKDAMYGYVKAVELASAKVITPTTDAPDGKYTTENGNLQKGSEKITINFKGTKPTDGGEVILSKGNVVSATLEFDGIPVTYNGKEAIVEESSSSTPTPVMKAYDVGEPIYYNPETNRKCNEGEVNTTEDAKTGCLKWYVIVVEDTVANTSVDAILDHNTTKNIAWSSSSYDNQGMKEAAITLQQDTMTWDADIKQSVRLITGQEIVDIVGESSWTDDSTTIVSLLSAPWLTDNLLTSGTPLGYWTSTVSSADSDLVWIARSGYCFENMMAGHRDDIGIRPVITISKSILN